MVSGGTETEVKIRVSDPADFTSRLSKLGFRVSAPRVFEANTLYDTEDGRLRQDKMILRLREAGEKRLITWKGPGGVQGRHKSRAELETAVGSSEIMHEIFAHLGYQPSFRYEKYRTEFTHEDGEGTVTLDETPVGTFVELEGSGDWIDQTAGRLGFAPTDYVLDSYGTLYQKYCREHGLQPKNMVFPS